MNLSVFIWSVVPGFVVLAAIWLLVYELRHRSGRRPFSKKDRLLRPPGETLRVKLDKLNDRFYTRMLIVFGVTVTVALIVQHPQVSAAKGTFFFLIFAGSAIALTIVLWTWKLVKEMHNVYLGFQGERFVGEEINRLMLDGCRVYHDIQMNGIGNIDHVVVARHAIFAVETKAKRKRWKIKGEDDYKMKYDGKKLSFPPEDKDDVRMLQQAARNANELSKYLARLTREDIEVKAILTFPGWWIDRVGKGEVNVLNAKELRSAILDSKARPMDKTQRQRIIALLEEKCRDVEP